MSRKNKQVILMFQHAQKNPSFAVKLGMSLNDIDKVVTIGNAEGFEFTKEEFLGHLKAVANDAPKAPGTDWFGEGPTSSAMGEEDRKPRQLSGDDEYLCTMAIPEEGKPRTPERDDEDFLSPTTAAIGEEDKKPPRDGSGMMTTLAIPEEGRPRTPEKNNDDGESGTTLALGEEDRKPPRDGSGMMTTLAIPEETKPRKPRTPREDFKDLRPTTLAVGEEGKKPLPPKKPENDDKKKGDKSKDLDPRKRPPMTTLAVGEEGRGPR